MSRDILTSNIRKENIISAFEDIKNHSPTDTKTVMIDFIQVVLERLQISTLSCKENAKTIKCMKNALDFLRNRP